MSAPKLTAGGMIVPTNGGGNRYIVRSILGNGGAVVTYHCASANGKEVAVKLYDPAVAAHATVMKSLEQAYAATNNSPLNSAAPIIDAGFDEATVAPFSVTELIHLPSLAAQQRRFGVEEVVSLLKGLARSLDLAHVRPVVHGAIKPTNVFAGAACNPVIVTDFAANLPKAAVPTQEGFLVSAPWIAPEQAQSGSVTPAADVFSVGLLVFYALTGRTYWRSTQGQTFDLNGWQQELASARTPASARAAELGVPLSPSLDMVIWKALSNDPNERFRSIGEFAGVLEDSLRQSAGTAATMALPIIGDQPPSPLPADMRNPEAPRPNSGPMMQQHQQHQQHQQQSSPPTMALTPDQLMPPQGQMQAGQYAQQGYGNPQYGGQPQGQQQQYGGQPQGQQGMTQLGMQQPPGMNVPQPSPSQAGAYAYSQSQGRDPGYPPPPLPNPNPTPKSKLIPVVIGFTAIALLGLVGTVIFLKLRSEKQLDETPVAVTSTATAAPATSQPTAKPPETATASTPTATAPPVTVDVTIKCKPGCDEVKVDNAVVDAQKPLKLAPGTHDVELKKAGFLTASEKIEVKAGTPLQQTFTLTPEKVERPSTGTPTTPTATSKPTTGGGKPPCKKGFLTKC